MNKYMKKWHFKTPFEWVNEDGIKIKACFRGFINTTHECAASKDMPQDIPDFTFTIWTEGDELGWHGHFNNPYSGEKEDIGICGSMYLVSAYREDTNGNTVYVSKDDLKHTKDEWLLNATVIYGFPKLEQKITNADIYSTEYLVLDDGWKRLSREDRYAEIKKSFDECENIKKTISWINSRDFSGSEGDESVRVLLAYFKEKINNLVSSIFGKDISMLKDYRDDFDNVSDFYYFVDKYISDNYIGDMSE